MIYYFKYMTFWKKRVYNNGEETSDWEDFKDGQRVDQVKHRNFFSLENSLYLYILLFDI